MKQQSVEIGEIEHILVRTYAIVANDRPHRVAPINVFDAKMSLPFCLSVAAYARSVTEGIFTEESIADEALARTSLASEAVDAVIALVESLDELPAI
jgi:hypothetical protein